MANLQILPDNILRRQVCQECFQYLSIPPISTNNLGETICGRCVNNSDLLNNEIGTYTKSSYNIIAERFLYKCTNHLDGCTKVLSMSKITEHERTCSYEKQECIFCSFLGNLSQILNHSIKFHSANVSLNGKFSFFLDNKEYQEQLLLVLNDSIFHLNCNITDMLFTVIISPITKFIGLKSNQYGIRFFKPNDATNINFIYTDYGLMNDSMETYFKKSKGELVSVFGLSIELKCEILIQQFSLSEKEFEFKQRYARLRSKEEQIQSAKQALQILSKKLIQQNKSYTTAMNVIKRTSYNIFKCRGCKKIALKEAYFCPKNHCYCKSCLKSICIECKSIQEYSKFEEIEKLLVTCDWPECNNSVYLIDYMKHKRECLKRPYKCPLQNCYEVVFSMQTLVEHWHCQKPLLTDEHEITCKIGENMEYYWMVEGDLYHVLINFNDALIQVLINEIDVVPNSICFKCDGFINGGWKRFESSMFCGKFQVYMSNSVSFRKELKSIILQYTNLCIFYKKQISLL